ncbi:esterase [Occallatibacter riparius]|uniref:Alpha/beta hydrolase-fold protein n=1 Tax=Occallatibacter riparius TaxID=1002689 RepID=A0A9J7BXT4_9BACT|nr:esterase [Occallatibacter riparius]UWZ85886.1 alpha/beta hydrolase-fold protein [Occallatibacter riparius]
MLLLSKLVSLSILLTATALSAQQPTPPPIQRPAPTPNDTLKSVEVQPDRHVRFRIWAPNATEVKLQAEGPEATPDITPAEAYKNMGGVPLTKGDQGIWDVTIGPITPGIYRYNFVVDGVATTDPRNPLTSQSLTSSRSMYEVPGADFMEYKAGVPHGAIATVYYDSTATNNQRRMHIYTPPGYEAGTTRLPVLYLLHGGGDSDDSWSTVGRAGAILDNLIGQGKALPMIIVMPAGHTSTEFRLTPGVRMGHDAFNDDLVKVVLPYVDTHYRSVADRDHRALAGLSMGGAQALNIALDDSADFAWIGIFSSGWFPNTLKEEEDTDIAKFRSSGKPFKLFWVNAGKYDIALQNSHATVALLKKAGIQVDEHQSEGFHAWNNWRDYLRDFTPLLFRTAK